jgi:hypothetical protein
MGRSTESAEDQRSVSGFSVERPKPRFNLQLVRLARNDMRNKAIKIPILLGLFGVMAYFLDRFTVPQFMIVVFIYFVLAMVIARW